MTSTLRDAASGRAQKTATPDYSRSTASRNTSSTRATPSKKFSSAILRGSEGTSSARYPSRPLPSSRHINRTDSPPHVSTPTPPSKPAISNSNNVQHSSKRDNTSSEIPSSTRSHKPSPSQNHHKSKHLSQSSCLAHFLSLYFPA